MRLQLHRGFTFADAKKLVPYMTSLGISHLYASPILTARPGSMHGYDVIDPTRVNAELGGEGALRDLVVALREAGLGLIVDIVPNHMAAGGMENPWWGDVLQHGSCSRYATFFDIDWNTPDPALRGKLLAPVLGEPYGEALHSGTLTLVWRGECAAIRYYDIYFPIRPEDHAEIFRLPSNAYDPTDEAGRARLHRLLERQHYRLAWWRCGNDVITWRRFFDINGLVAVRVQDEAVFEATHATLLRLHKEGIIDGFRIDHVDGLTDPPGYCRRLRARLNENSRQDCTWIVAEKILGSGEHLPDDWAVDGTSGYDFMDEVSALLHDASGQAALQRLWHSLSGRPADLDVEECTARGEVLCRSFSAQLDAAVAELHWLARAELQTRDTTPVAIRRALTTLLVHFRVYRTYGAGPSEGFARALARATAAAPAADHPT
ncbi:MAG TPA: malto-oligosyltrehalose synthase, partial [Ktedonobacterales bacterium]|nr:malto-oligosyltrehalose synthase [Ktedonobacterales bacterium]